MPSGNIKRTSAVYKDASFSEQVSQLNWNIKKRKLCFSLLNSKQCGRFPPPISTLGRQSSKSPFATRPVQTAAEGTAYQ